MGQVGIAGALTDHGAGHQQVDDRCVRRTGSYLHQGISLGSNGVILKAVFLGSGFTSGAGLHSVDKGLVSDGLFRGGLGGGSGLFLLGAAGGQGQDHHGCQQQRKHLFHIQILQNFGAVSRSFNTLVVYHAKLSV